MTISIFNPDSINSELSKPTSIFGLKLWVVIGILLGSLIVIALFFLSLCLTSRRRNRRPRHADFASAAVATPPISKEIQEIVRPPAADHYHQTQPVAAEIQVDIGKIEHRVVFSDRVSSGESRGTVSASETASFSGNGCVGPEVSHLGWGRWYTLRELEAATNGLCEENVIGEGGYGIVYRGILTDGTKVAVKNLLNNRGQAEKEFRVEVEAIGRVRHKNLVRLLGYCVEGAYRMLVYDYVDNGNLEQWIHGDVGDKSPLTWDIRTNIILGMAKGLAYLHEAISLLDRQWNAKVSDFGLAKLLFSESSYVTTRVMGTFGYVAPEYACTGMLNEKSDIYSFGILIMELITGRNPVDYSRPQGEVNLVEWLKSMVGNRRSEEVIDPKIPEPPSSKALKRVLLVALRCVDPDANKRPKMGHIIHMLEAEDLFYRDERRATREHASRDFNQRQTAVSAGATVAEITESDSSRDPR
ncbi:hypothetical protein EUTSA_v10028635mg [Eutrema salsugineum]|uniref:non-specific serine/threonine protein kinase n=1 Tax=Eutrema salsugineum TaxID=72664 RepID=V4KIR2_EUTSA|nr:hypothetical protein EUTSA_v10028635mg [Eutrema salsugineum]